MIIWNVDLGKRISFVSFLGVLSANTALAQGTRLYDLDFSSPDVGLYQVMAGHPSVQSNVGVFTDALVFDAVNTGAQIRLPIGTSAPAYDLSFDLLGQNLANSDYAFGVFFGGSAGSSLNFDGGLNTIYLFESSPFVNVSLQPLNNNAVYHLDILLGTQSSTWSVEINGSSVFSGSWNSTSLQDIRFGLAPWIGGAADAPATYVALDNIRVTAVPEPGTISLIVAGALGAITWYRRSTRK